MKETILVGDAVERDKCWLCGGKLIWQGDYSPCDLGLDPGVVGIVVRLSCSICGAAVEYTSIKQANDDGDNVE